jgi:hypothetical protein
LCRSLNPFFSSFTPWLLLFTFSTSISK